MCVPSLTHFQACLGSQTAVFVSGKIIIIVTRITIGTIMRQNNNHFLHEIPTLLVHTACPPLPAALSWYSPWEAAQSLLLRPTLWNIGHDQENIQLESAGTAVHPLTPGVQHTCYERVKTYGQVCHVCQELIINITALQESREQQALWESVASTWSHSLCHCPQYLINKYYSKITKCDI